MHFGLEAMGFKSCWDFFVLEVELPDKQCNIIDTYTHRNVATPLARRLFRVLRVENRIVYSKVLSVLLILQMNAMDIELVWLATCAKEFQW